MTPEEHAALQGHITGEVQAPYFDPSSIYDDDPVEGRSIIGWLAVLVFGALIVAGLWLKLH